MHYNIIKLHGGSNSGLGVLNNNQIKAIELNGASLVEVNLIKLDLGGLGLGGGLLGG